jgi:hypothetical protein
MTSDCTLVQTVGAGRLLANRTKLNSFRSMYRLQIRTNFSSSGSLSKTGICTTLRFLFAYVAHDHTVNFRSRRRQGGTLFSAQVAVSVKTSGAIGDRKLRNRLCWYSGVPFCVQFSIEIMGHCRCGACTLHQCTSANKNYTARKRRNVVFAKELRRLSVSFDSSRQGLEQPRVEL